MASRLSIPKSLEHGDGFNMLRFPRFIFQNLLACYDYNTAIRFRAATCLYVIQCSSYFVSIYGIIVNCSSFHVFSYVLPGSCTMVPWFTSRATILERNHVVSKTQVYSSYICLVIPKTVFMNDHIAYQYNLFKKMIIISVSFIF